MLMGKGQKETEGTVYGRDIKSAFNRQTAVDVLAGFPDLALRVNDFLRPRTF